MFSELNHSRSRLLERDSAERRHRDSKKVKRSQSDVGRGVDKHHRSRHIVSDRQTDRHGDKHLDRHSSKHSDKHVSQEQFEKIHVSQQKSRSLERPSDSAARPKIHTNDSSTNTAAYDNPAFSRSSETEKLETQAVSRSTSIEEHGTVLSAGIALESQVATDSMKLQDKKEQRPIINKTDDEKYVVDDSEDIKLQHYVYKGSIYTVPEKLTQDQPDGYEENPIVRRMEEMIMERTGEKMVSSVEPKVKDTAGQSKSLPVDSVYTEVADVVRESKSLTASASRNSDTGETVGESDKNKGYQSQESHDDLGLKGNVLDNCF